MSKKEKRDTQVHIKISKITNRNWYHSLKVGEVP